MREALVSRWLTPDGQRRRGRLLELGLQGPWREVLAGFPGNVADHGQHWLKRLRAQVDPRIQAQWLYTPEE